MKRFLPLLKVFLALALADGLGMAAFSWWEYQAGIRAYETAAELAHLPSAVQKAGGSSSSQPEKARTEELAQLDLAALLAVNPDVVGWIEIPGTQLSYPLVLGTDNQYYLNHTWNGQRNSSGAIFLDHTTAPELDGFHALVYGHRMDNDTMFGMLKYYKDLDFWREHPSIFLVTDSGVSRYDIFSAREADVRGITYRLDLESSRLETDFIQDCIDSSVIDTGIVPETSDRILTLSTCISLGYSSTRWVVQAVLREECAR